MRNARPETRGRLLNAPVVVVVLLRRVVNVRPNGVTTLRFSSEFVQ